MTVPPPSSFVAECFLTGVTNDDVRAMDVRAGASAEQLTDQGRPVRYLGSILMRGDEVVLCLFEGAAYDVQLAARRAEIPFERIIESTQSRWPDAASPG